MQVQAGLARHVAQRDRDDEPACERDQRWEPQRGARRGRLMGSGPIGKDGNGDERDGEKDAVRDLMTGQIPEQANKTGDVRRRKPRVRRSVTEEVRPHRDHRETDRRHAPCECAERATQTSLRATGEHEQGGECDDLRREDQRAEEVRVDR